MKTKKPSNKSNTSSQQHSPASIPLQSQAEVALRADAPGVGNPRVSAEEIMQNSETDANLSRAVEAASEGLDQWELEHKREASRLSSMRCQQRKRRRVEHLKESQDQLRVLNQSLMEQNESLRTAIALVRQVIQAIGHNNHSVQASAGPMLVTPFDTQGLRNNAQTPVVAATRGQNTSEPLIQPGLDLASILNASFNQQQAGGHPNDWFSSAGRTAPTYNPQNQAGILPPSVLLANASSNPPTNNLQGSLALLQNHLQLPQHRWVGNNHQQINTLTQNLLSHFQAYLMQGNNLESNVSTVTTSDGGTGQGDSHDEDRDSSTRTSSHQSSE